MVDRSLAATGCPFCSGQKTCKCCSLAAKHPELMEQWDWEGSQGADPDSMSCYSRKRVSWICTEHGQWDASPALRVHNKTACPKCARQRRFGARPVRRYLSDELPNIYAQLHPTKNSGTDVEKLTCGSAKMVWWLCRSDKSRPEGCQHEHAWEARVYVRCNTHNNNKQSFPGCPFCSGRRICPCNSLAVIHSDLLQYWDFSNADQTGEPLDPFWLGVYSNKAVWWRHECADGRVHHWCARISNVVECFEAKSRRVPCPGCARKIPASESAEQHAKLIKRK